MFRNQFFPFRITLVDKSNLLVSGHVLYLLFALDGTGDVREFFKIHAVFAVVFVGKGTLEIMVLMLCDSFDDVRGATGVQRGVPFVCHDVCES